MTHLEVPMRKQHACLSYIALSGLHSDDSSHISPSIPTACHLSIMLSYQAPLMEQVTIESVHLPCSCSCQKQDTYDEDTPVHDKCRRVCHLQGSAGVNMLQGGEGLRGQNRDRMQLAASQAHVACVQSLPTRLHNIPTRSL